MFGIGFTEILLILIVGLLIIGPEKLPELAKTLGKALNEFKRTTNDIKRAIEGEPKRPSRESSVTFTEEDGQSGQNAPAPRADLLEKDEAQKVDVKEEPKKRRARKKTAVPRRVRKKSLDKSSLKNINENSNGEDES